MGSNYGIDVYPQLLCLVCGHTRARDEDSSTEKREQGYGAVNRHYMEYSMYRFVDVGTRPTAL